MSGWTNGLSNYNSTTLMNIGNKSDTRLTNINNFEFVLPTNGTVDYTIWHPVSQVDINRRSEFNGNNINVTEIVINTNGQSDENKWIEVVHKDLTVNAGNDAWKIPLTFATDGVNMSVELAGLREYSTLEDRYSFNVSINNTSGPPTSKPVVFTMSIDEALVVAGNWRTPDTGYVILVEEFTFNTRKYQGTGLLSSQPLIINIPVKEQLVIDDQWRTPWVAGEEPQGAYKVAGTTTHGARVIIVDEDTWEVEHTTIVPLGDYSVTGLQPGLKTVVSRKEDGEEVAYGAVDAVPQT